MGCGGGFFLSQAIILSTAVQQGERFYVTSRFSFRVSLPATGLWLFDVYLCSMPFDEGSSYRFLIKARVCAPSHAILSHVLSNAFSYNIAIIWMILII